MTLFKRLDENDFFRGATLRIFGSLEMETAMAQSLLYLNEFMPADHLILGLYDTGLGAVRTVLVVASGSGKQPNTLIPLPADARQVIEHRRDPNEVSIDRIDQDAVRIRIVNDPVSDPIIGRIFRPSAGIDFNGTLGRPRDSSFLSMQLATGGATVGIIILQAAGKGRYTEEHGRLLALLREPFAIAMSNALEHQEVLKLRDILAEDNRYLHRELFHLSDDYLAGAGGGLGGVMEMVMRVAPLDSHVLLRGETGVGKDVIAHAIHDASARREGPFIRVNCGAIADPLIDSELFGHERGAFTDASAQRRGCFEMANHGTVFLDEIGELPLPAQVKMLRVLQYKEIQRVGGSTPIVTDVRVIAATHRDLEDMVRAGRFREDLWFRLNVFPIVIPPLRQRKGDIPALVYHLMQRKAKELKLPTIPTLAHHAIDCLMAYDWPGNVRELENVLERALILSSGEPLSFDHLLISKDEGTEAANGLSTVTASIDQVVSHNIRQALQRSGGKIEGPGGAAELLALNPSTLRSKMNRLGIPYGRGGRRGRENA